MCAIAFCGVTGPPLPSLRGALVFALHSLSSLVALTKALLLHAAWTIAWSCAIGTTLAFALEDRPATAVSLARRSAYIWPLAYLLVALRDGSWLAGPVDMALALVGLTLGSALGLDLRARLATGRWGSLTLRLSGTGALLAVLLIGLSLAPFGSEPALPASAPSTSDTRRSLAHLVAGMDPRKVPDGETRTLAVTAAQLDQLVAWAAEAGLRARSRVELHDGGVEVRASLPLPRARRWLELWASADLAMHEHQVVVHDARARVGWLYLPGWLLRWPVGWVQARLTRDADVQAVLSAVHGLSLQQSGVAVTYSHLTTGGGLAARLAWGDDETARIRESVTVQLEQLLATLTSRPSEDERMTVALQASFALAQARSRERSPVQENRAAIMALGIVLGSEKILRIFGERPASERVATIVRMRDATTLRGRGDWTRHFAISGAVTVLSSVAPSNAVGLLKEELDADGGSGFSFADLLADRAGTALAEHATHDEASARSMQQKLAAMASVDGYFPRADGLPEGIQDADFQRDYGGVGGPRYNALVADIERRVDALYQR